MRALNKEILRLAIPSILANITVPLVGMVDLAIAGHLPGAAACLGGVSVGALLFTVLYWNFAFLRAGTGGLTAQAFGRSRTRSRATHPRTILSRDQNTSISDVDTEKTAPDVQNGHVSDTETSEMTAYVRNRPQSDMEAPGMTAHAQNPSIPDVDGETAWILQRGLAMALVIAVVLIALQWPFAKLGLLVVGGTHEMTELAMRYFFVRIWAAPATLCLMVFRGWFIGMQDTRSSMWVDLIVNLVNIAASTLLVFKAGIGFDGIATGTVIAQYAGLIFAVVVCARKYSTFRVRNRPQSGMKTGGRWNIRELLSGSGAFFRLNADLFVRSLCFMGIYFGFSAVAARYGNLALAVSSLMMNLLMLFSYFTDGFAYAGEALTGRYIGERNRHLLKKSVRLIFIWSMAVAFLWLGIYGLAGTPLLHLMTDDAIVVEAARKYLPWLILMPPMGCAAFTWDGIYTGATATKGMRNAMIGAMIAFFTVWFSGRQVFGLVPAKSSAEGALHLLLAAYFAHLAVRTVWLSATYRKDVLPRA